MMNVAGFALLVSSAALLTWGCADFRAMRLDFSQFLWGVLTDRIALLFLGGAAALLTSLRLLLPSRIHETQPAAAPRNDGPGTA